jgi:hypothetical protein
MKPLTLLSSGEIEGDWTDFIMALVRGIEDALSWNTQIILDKGMKPNPQVD